MREDLQGSTLDSLLHPRCSRPNAAIVALVPSRSCVKASQPWDRWSSRVRRLSRRAVLVVAPHLQADEREHDAQARREHRDEGDEG
jgi:hypothetical protein